MKWSAAASITAFAIALGSVLAISGPASAQDTAQVSLSQSASQLTAAPGGDFTFYLTWSCASLAVACEGATVSDTLPTQVARAAADVSFGGNFAGVLYTSATGTALFTLFSPLGAGTIAQIAITVHFPAGTPAGTTATNQASIDAANAAPALSNQVTVTSTAGADATDPTVDLRTPSDGATHWLGESVDADYACSDEVGGSGLKSCVGTVADGTAIDTVTLGDHDFTVVATDNDGNQHSVTHTYAVTRPRPDARIKQGANGTQVGDGIYNTTGRGQTRQGSAPRTSSVTYFVSVQNDAPRSNRLRLLGSTSTSSFKVTYTAGASDISSKVVAGTYTTADLAPGARRTIKVVVTVKRAAAVGARLAAFLTVSSSSDPERKDTVRFVTNRSR